MFEYVIAALVVLILLLIARGIFNPTTVFEYEKGLKYRKGRFESVLGPGRYWHRPAVTKIEKVDLRPTFESIGGQEVLSSDGVTLKVSIAARYRVLDPATAINEVEDYRGTLYLELQLALREIIGSTPIDDLLAKRQEIGLQLMEKTSAKATQMGLELLETEIKDVMFPGKLKEIFAQVVKARQEGLAALEKARGETAALRNLANAAQLLEHNPNLMQLRLLQVMGETQGNTVVLGVQPGTGPLPLKSKELPAVPDQAGEGDE
jgi:regulator of protease activity HflC (stomatin/prohibitin superfamily)